VGRSSGGGPFDFAGSVRGRGSEQSEGRRSVMYNRYLLVDDVGFNYDMTAYTAEEAMKTVTDDYPEVTGLRVAAKWDDDTDAWKYRD
jgi:hypothetical protein